jgi:hypothetical protein
VISSDLTKAALDVRKAILKHELAPDESLVVLASIIQVLINANFPEDGGIKDSALWSVVKLLATPPTEVKYDA